MKPTAADFRFWKAREPTPQWAVRLGASQPMLRPDTVRALHDAVNSHGPPLAYKLGSQSKALDKANAIEFCRGIRGRLVQSKGATVQVDTGRAGLAYAASLREYLEAAKDSSARYVIYRRWLRRMTRNDP